jgi:hypothetical protein
MNMKIPVFWGFEACGLVKNYQRFGGTFYPQVSGTLNVQTESCSETTALFYQTTRCYITDDSNPHSLLFSQKPDTSLPLQLVTEYKTKALGITNKAMTK